MGLLFPEALALFALTPLLVVAYLTRERPRRVRVSSVMIFRSIGGGSAGRFGGKPQLDWLFFIELLILCLAVLALAGPFVTQPSRMFAAVLDNSVAMQAKTATGTSRFQAATDRLTARLRELNAGDRVTVYVTTPHPHALGPAFDSPAAAASALRNLSATDAPTDPGALAGLLGQLVSDNRLNSIYYAGVYPVMPPIPPRLRVDAFDTGLPNAALGAFTLRRDSFTSTVLHGRIVAANYGIAPERFTVTVTAGGRILAQQKAEMQPDQVTAFDFPKLPLENIYRAELVPTDALPVDNVAWAVNAGVRSIAVLFVSPRPADAEGLESIPGLSISVRAPDAYTPDDLARADVAIFEYSAPKVMPTVNTLLVMPPPDDPVFNFDVMPVSSAAVTSWRTTDPITDAVNFLLLNPRAGETFGVHPWMRPVVSGANGAMVLRGERQNHRFVATGFNLFPYLGRENLPMSILTLNMLSYLVGLGSSSSGYRTGQAWIIPATVETVVMPSGQRIAVKPGTTFDGVTEQGIYQLVSDSGAKTLRAVNLDDLTVSDLKNPPAIKVEATGPAVAAPEATMTRKSLSGYLLAAILALVLLEAFVVYSRRRSFDMGLSA
jgi:hypothetical protein